MAAIKIFGCAVWSATGVLAVVVIDYYLQLRLPGLRGR
jgi:hypothetical protein